MKLLNRLKTIWSLGESPMRIVESQLITVRKDRDYLVVVQSPYLRPEDVEPIRQALRQAFKRKLPMLLLGRQGEIRFVEVEKTKTRRRQTSTQTQGGK